jgi:hypothetical protein
MRHTDPLACDGLPSLRMLLSVVSMYGIREFLRQFADRADEAEMISLWPSSRTSAIAFPPSAQCIALKGGSASSGGPAGRDLLPEGEGKGAYSDFWADASPPGDARK